MRCLRLTGFLGHGPVSGRSPDTRTVPVLQSWRASLHRSCVSPLLRPPAFMMAQFSANPTTAHDPTKTAAHTPDTPTPSQTTAPETNTDAPPTASRIFTTRRGLPRHQRRHHRRMTRDRRRLRGIPLAIIAVVAAENHRLEDQRRPTRPKLMIEPKPHRRHPRVADHIQPDPRIVGHRARRLPVSQRERLFVGDRLTVFVEPQIAHKSSASGS